MSRLYITCEPGAVLRGPFATREGAIGGAIKHALERGERAVELSFSADDLDLFKMTSANCSAQASRSGANQGRRGAPTVVAGWAKIIGKLEFEQGILPKAKHAGANFWLIGLSAKGNPEVLHNLGPALSKESMQPAFDHAKANQELPAKIKADSYQEIYLCWTAPDLPLRAVYRRSK